MMVDGYLLFLTNFIARDRTYCMELCYTDDGKMNIFNTKAVRMDSFNSSLISTYEYFIQKRYWLFTIKYDL